MFFSEVFALFHQGGALENSLTGLEEERRSLIEKFRRQQDHWQSLGFLNSGEIRAVNQAFCEYLRSEGTMQIIFACTDFREKRKEKVLTEDFIRLLLPCRSADIAERIRVQFLRLEMLARTDFIFSKIADMIRSIPDGGKERAEFFAAESHTLSPLDSPRVFMQFMNNHIADCNWQKISCSRDQKMSFYRRRALLDIEYRQCQYSAGDPDYGFLENKYRMLEAQIESDYGMLPMGNKTYFTPWPDRSILKQSVTFTKQEEHLRWSWKRYCMLKDLVGDKTPSSPRRDPLMDPFRKMELFHE